MAFNLARTAMPTTQLRSSFSTKAGKSALKPRMTQRRNMVVRADGEGDGNATFDVITCSSFLLRVKSIAYVLLTILSSKRFLSEKPRKGPSKSPLGRKTTVKIEGYRRLIAADYAVIFWSHHDTHGPS
eukprot:2650989-Pyramimonas_sp.AAC.1